MKTSDLIRQLCEQMNISVSELARRLGQSPQNFGNIKLISKVKRDYIVSFKNRLTICIYMY